MSRILKLREGCEPLCNFVDMFSRNINKYLKRFLEDIFCGVSRNSPYKNNDFLCVLVDAAEHEDFTNNSAKRVGGPTGETVFSRLKNADFEKIKTAFYSILTILFSGIKIFLRNRKVALAFDTTDEPYYGKVAGLWIHSYQPVRGSTGCFKYITVSIACGDRRFILGNLPVRVGADTVALVMELIEHAKQFVSIEIVLFDRGFDNYELIESLQKAGIRYQILWRKQKWTTKELKKMKRGELHEICKERKYSKNKSKHKVKVRFVLIKKYKRTPKAKAYNWVFATNTRQKSQHFYVDKYRKRWSIETVFRVLDDIRIKTTTKNEIIRYFINIFCCLLYNLWKFAKLFGVELSFKNFVAAIFPRGRIRIILQNMMEVS